MRLLPSCWALCLCALTACSQTPHQPADGQAGAGVERSETRVTEDDSVRIEETRVGGEIKRIRVFPKGGQAPYDIDPVTRLRIWKIAEFLVMAVYTEVRAEEAGVLFDQLKLGTITAMQGCAGGIENTNYFVTTEHEGQTFEHVLTLFERLSSEQLPFYLRLMKHLAVAGIPVPDPVANRDGDLVHTLKGKPAAIVNRLRGKSELTPSTAHCAALGAMLARMHLASRDFSMTQPNLRGLDWWNETVPVVLPYLDTAQASLIRTELAYQNHVAASSAYQALPRGPIHADLFRDNALFETIDGHLRLSGCFDFYFAGVDTWLFDVAVCLNDWCIDHDVGEAHAERSHGLLAAYAAVRPLSAAERRMLPAMLRAAALRFWLSRLWDFYLPREASLLKAHDPAPLERVLRLRAWQPQGLGDSLQP